VFDLEAAARAALPPAHWGYLATGVDDDATLEANHAAYRRIRLRPRRLVDVTRVDTGVTLFGRRWPTPIVLAPAGSQKAFHPDGEIAVARAAQARDHLQILSSVTTSSVEAVTGARGAPVWYQLYPTSRWDITRRLLERAEDAGCPVVVLTVDIPVGSRRETQQRWRRLDSRDCSGCHGDGPAAFFARKPMYDDTGIRGFDEFMAPGLTWDFVDRLRARTRMKLVLKGIGTREDAALCLEHGVDGIVVSNHGGRSEDSGMATIDSLPEVVAAAGGRIPVLVDGGIRRGSDVFKALALGADAVCIGRPYLWGLSAFGKAGVECALDLLRRELETVMAQCGAPRVADIGPRFVQLP
jgi:isopentenyl diphosphate isomerase/L-lactate dehydrogenase-like FMN-dependent dehydrogenase